MFTERFSKYATIGDHITCEVDGITYIATLEIDYDWKPTDCECYDEEQLAAWRNDDWWYVGVVLSAHVEGLEIEDHAASLWGVECNFPGTDNTYLRDVANELLPEAILSAQASARRLRLALDKVA